MLLERSAAFQHFPRSLPVARLISAHQRALQLSGLRHPYVTTGVNAASTSRANGAKRQRNPRKTKQNSSIGKTRRPAGGPCPASPRALRCCSGRNPSTPPSRLQIPPITGQISVYPPVQPPLYKASCNPRCASTIVKMLRSIISKRSFSSTSAAATKVAVLGAAGGIGQPLSLLLKLNKQVTGLSLYDLRGTPGVAADLSHIPTNSVVKGYTPEKGGIEAALKDVEVVVIPAGVPRKPGMTRDDLFNTNASIVRDLAKSVADVAPKAAVLVIANPVNSTVPIVAEVFKSKGVYDPKKLFGVTTLDVIRSSRFISEVEGTDPTVETVPVVGGHSGPTIVPLISQSSHPDLSGEKLDGLVHRIQYGGDEVVKAKDGAGSATLSMAEAGARFASKVIAAFQGEKGVTECTYVDSPLYKGEGIEFFSSPVTLGPEGIAEVHPIGKLNQYEEKLLVEAKEGLKKNIKKGVDFVKANP